MAKARTVVGLECTPRRSWRRSWTPRPGVAALPDDRGHQQGGGVLRRVGGSGAGRDEAGPTGYGLARELARRGVGCVVAAPSKIPRAWGTGRRPIVGMRSCSRACCWRGSCTRSGAGSEEEALRDLVRAREAVRVDLMRCRHRLSKLLLRHGIRYEDGRVDRPSPPVARAGHARARAGADDAAGRPRRDRRADAPARAARARDHRARPRRRGACRPGGSDACAGSTR